MFKILNLTIPILFAIMSYCYGNINVNFESSRAKNLTYRMVIAQTVLNDYKGIQLALGKTDSVGRFTVNLKIDKEQEAILFIGNQYYKIWLGTEGVIHIVEENGLMKFTGNYANENNVLYLGKFMQSYPLLGYSALDKTKVLEHLRVLDSLEKKRISLLNANKNKLSSLFFEQMNQETVYFTIYRKSQFAALNKLEADELPVKYFDFWNKFEILSDGVISKSYFGSINDYAEFKVKQRFGNKHIDKSTAIKAQFKFLDSLLINSPKTLEVVQGEAIVFFIKYLDNAEMINVLRSSYVKKFPNSDYAKLIETNWLIKNQQYLKKPIFSLKDTNGQAVSIESFRGKVVYIDFWGSWCKACLLEMPYARKLREKFKNDQIVFLYIDFNDTKELWINAIKAHGITGVNLKGEVTDEKYFDDFFGIKNGFPRYAVIDKNGFLITTAAPSPSNDKVVDYLIKLL